MSDIEVSVCHVSQGNPVQELLAKISELSSSSLRREMALKRLQPVGERVYSGASGSLYIARSYARTIKASRTVDIYLSLNDEPMEFFVAGRRRKLMAVVFPPLVTRTVMDYGSGLICVSINPTHATYRQLSSTATEKMRVLDRAMFSALNDALRDACLGSLDLSNGLKLLSNIASTAALDLPASKPLDSRVALTRDLLHTDTNRSLEDLAAAVGLSYYRLSHLFSESIGLSLRSYQLWLKIDQAWRHVQRGYSTAEIAALSGFSDASHLCHVFQDTYGVPMIHHLRNLSMKIDFNLR